MVDLNTPVRGEKIVVLDTETNAIKNPRVIEVAYGYLDDAGGELKDVFTQRYDPQAPIDYGALATHNILPSDLLGCPAYTEFSLPEDVGYAIGHNVDFDLGVIGNPAGVRAIDTLALAGQMWPDLDSHKQSALIYFLYEQMGKPMQEARDLVVHAHGAAADIQMCHMIYRHIEQELAPRLSLCDEVMERALSPIERMFWASLAAKIPFVMTFGKHKGMLTIDVPWSYKNWYRGAEDTDPMVLFAMGFDVPKDFPMQAMKTLRDCLFSERASSLDQAQDVGGNFALQPTPVAVYRPANS